MENINDTVFVMCPSCLVASPEADWLDNDRGGSILCPDCGEPFPREEYDGFEEV